MLSNIAFCITYNEEQITISEIYVSENGLEVDGDDSPNYDGRLTLALPDIDFETSLVLLKFISREE